MSSRISKQNPSSQVLVEGVRRALASYHAEAKKGAAGLPCTGLLEMVIPVVEKEVIAHALQQCSGNQTAAAKMLGVSRTTLNNKMTRLQIKGIAAKVKAPAAKR